MRHAFIFLLLSCICASAIDRITATLTFTNATATGNTLTVNGNVRTWTNQVFVSGTQIITNSDATGCGSKTNALSQIALNPFSQVTPLNTGSNTFQLFAPCGAALIVSASAGYASVTYSTQTCLSGTPLVLPLSNIPGVATRSNLASQLESDLLGYTTNSQIVDLAKTQIITGPKTFTNQNNSYNGRLSNSVPTANYLNGGYWLNPVLNVPILTNGVNYSNAFSSPGTSIQSEQFGLNAKATDQAALAVGTSTLATKFGAVALGTGASALEFATTAVGYGADAEATNATALGTSANATGVNSTALGNVSAAAGYGCTAIGYNANTVLFTNATAVGQGSRSTADNQLMLGAPGISTVVQNNLTVQTNETVSGSFFVTGGENVLGLRTNAAFTGTNNFPPGADIAFGRFALSSLGNGINNDIVVGTNIFIEVSGPSASFSIEGIAGGRDGKYAIILNKTGFDMTIATEGGATGNDPTPANRITSMTGADRTTTGNGVATLIYSGSASRWILIAFDP